MIRNLFFYSLLCCFFIVSCKKKQTSWNTDWTVPIINDTISLNKYVSNGSIIVNSGYYELNFNRTLFDLNLTKIVEIPDTTFSKTFGILFSNFVLEPGTSFVNSVEEHKINLQDIELKKIRLSSGTISVKLENPVNTPVFFKIQLVGVTKNGIQLEEVFKAPAGSMTNPGIVEGDINLSNYEMDLTGITGGKFNILQSKFTVTTDPDGIKTSMTNKDLTNVIVKLNDLKIEYARGYFGDKILSDTLETSIDLLSKISDGSIDLPAADFKFMITNGIKVPAKLLISTIENIHSNGNTVPLIVNEKSNFQFNEPLNINSAIGSWSTLSESKSIIEFNSTNSNLENFLENLGITQKIGYSIQLNPWGNSSGGWNEIFPNSHLKAEVNASMPLNIGLDGLTLKNTYNFDLQQNTDKTHVVSGSLSLLATNTFPISGKISLDFLDVNGNLLFTILGNEVLKSAELGNSFSKGLKSCNSKLNFIFSNEMIFKLKDAKKVNVTCQFDTPNSSNTTNEKVKIPLGAFLGVKLVGDFKVENRY